MNEAINVIWLVFAWMLMLTLLWFLVVYLGKCFWPDGDDDRPCFM